ncbi:MAG: HlyD family efflux transporter periplasmic adaptor subunit [Lachnospiraceae bacterium]|nr:HlyD family efflux transporter periplasmic adaptor subunit [Lachnospiraceae bacterium]
MSRIKKVLFVLLASAILLLPHNIFAEDLDIIPQESIKADVVRYKTEEIGYGTFAKTETTSGVPYYPNVTYVLYDGLRALYVETLVEFGEFVEAGQELLKVEVEKDEAAIREMELKLSRARTTYEAGLKERRTEISNLNLDRNSLTDSYAIQKANLTIERREVALQQYIAQTEREIARQEEELTKLREDNAVTYVTAPIGGKITDLKYFQNGDYVNPGDTLFRITDTSVFYVSAESSTFHYGTDVTVKASVRGNEYSLPGKVVVSAADIKGVNKNNVLIRVEIPKELENLVEAFSGNQYMALRLSVNAETSRVAEVLLLPLDAKETSGQEVYVSLLDENNNVHRRPVIIAYSNRYYSWILEGLQEGDVVILN